MPAQKSSAALSPIWLVVVGILSVQWGAGIAKTLFEDADPTAVVWLRLATSAVVMVLVARPALRGHSRPDWLLVGGFGLCLAVMNWSFYQSFQRIPIGLAVTIEFIGPLSVALLGSRRARDLVWVALAALGVVLLGLEPGRLNVAGVVFALVAGAAWAAYILVAAETGRRWTGFDGLAVASVVAVGLLTPLALFQHLGDLSQPRVIALGALVGIMSSVIPYALELVALRSLPTATFGILMSLEPAAAALAGFVVVGEELAPPQLLAIACVIAASIGATRSGIVFSEPVPDLPFTETSHSGDGHDSPAA